MAKYVCSDTLQLTHILDILFSRVDVKKEITLHLIMGYSVQFMDAANLCLVLNFLSLQTSISLATELYDVYMMSLAEGLSSTKLCLLCR
jgi:hypothetical protein